MRQEQPDLDDSGWSGGGTSIVLLPKSEGGGAQSYRPKMSPKLEPKIVLMFFFEPIFWRNQRKRDQTLVDASIAEAGRLGRRTGDVGAVPAPGNEQFIWRINSRG